MGLGGREVNSFLTTKAKIALGAITPGELLQGQSNSEHPTHYTGEWCTQRMCSKWVSYPIYPLVIKPRFVEKKKMASFWSYI